MQRLACAVLCALLSVSVHATSFSTDVSDLWWNRQESGWGVNVMQQSDTLFMTFFVYATNGAPTWYVAPAVTYQGQSGASLVFTGALYQAAGPWFGAPFNPANVTNRQVGTVTFQLTSGTAAILTYTVDGVAVTKSIERQTWKAENFNGDYLGATVGTWSGCAQNGYGEEANAISIAQNGTSFQMRISQLTGAGVCTYTGTYAQDGHLGSVTGSFVCTSGSASVTGTFQAVELQVSFNAFEGRLRQTSAGCTYNARIGGVYRAGL